MSPSDPLPALPLPQLRAVLAVDLSVTFEGLEWCDTDDVYFVKFPAIRGDGAVDIYLTKWTFFDYPERPPRVTFVNPKTKEYDPGCWPDAGNSRVQLAPDYGGAPEGLVCNSMFADWYCHGGHGDQPAVSWKPGVDKAIATVTELREVLRPPHYRGPR